MVVFSGQEVTGGGREFDLNRSEVLLQPFQLPGARDDNDPRLLGEQPSGGIKCQIWICDRLFFYAILPCRSLAWAWFGCLTD